MGSFRLGVAVFAVHVGLLFFPPIPPLWKGSIWSYALSYLAVALTVSGLSASQGSLVARWAARPPIARWCQGLVILAGVALAAAVLRGAAPDLFARFSREEGVWEPLSLFCYVWGTILMFRTAGASTGSVRRHAWLVGAVFLFLVLEEIDYLGIFGGMIGRIDGVYVGSLHDLIRLWTEGLLSYALIAGGGILALAGSAELVRRDLLQPRRYLRAARSVRALWLAFGIGFLLLASAEEAGIVVRFGVPSPEELLELLGAICLGGFAMSEAAHLASELPEGGGPASRAEPDRLPGAVS